MGSMEQGERRGFLLSLPHLHLRGRLRWLWSEAGKGAVAGCLIGLVLAAGTYTTDRILASSLSEYLMWKMGIFAIKVVAPTVALTIVGGLGGLHRSAQEEQK